jgi:tetratricopeptide (TPR) repeat protein
MPRPSIALAVSLAVAASALPAQSSRATVREYQRVFPTYPFSDPNPVPVVGRIYPYFRFDGFTHRAEQRAWKVVELENEYLRVMILPEIGGKIWNAVDKRSNRSFIYFNHAVKFRDVAMRGPWTSGGIEANYGIFGHTPNVATPVDYVTRTNADGSVSCIIGALDLLTRTPWRIEIRLGRDDAMFSTTSFWYNASPLEQPYYTWMNVGIKVAGSLQFIYPGTSHVGHNGEHGPWPIDEKGRDISWYRNNDFGSYKSYHVVGKETDFFGGYWHDDDFGVVRYAPRDERAGKKIWIWGLARQGMIWEKLLTDSDGQYAEIQSGRLFTQSAEASTLTPFKHRGFAPHVADTWTEYWYPVAGTKGVVAASRVGALNVVPQGDAVVVSLSPAQRLADSLRVTAGSQTLYRGLVTRRPRELFTATVPLRGIAPDSVRVTLGDHLLDYAGAPGAGALARPLDPPPNFDWRSPYGLYLQGKEWLRQREYAKAAQSLDSALAREPFFVPALVDRAQLAVRAGEYERARRLTLTALSVDAYDPWANYYYGLANRRLGRLADAKDGFDVAASTPEMRGAAWTELARLALGDGQLSAANEYAMKALGAEPRSLDALGVAIVVARRRGDRDAHARLIGRLEAIDPLSHQARLERLVAAGDSAVGTALRRGVRAELPEQVLLDLAAWYLDVGDVRVAKEVLEAVGDHPEALYWRASLPGIADAGALIERANRLSPRFVFPFRTEMVPVLQAAAHATAHWKPRYYLALTLWGLGRTSEADSLLSGLGDEPDFAPFYAARAALPGRAAPDARRDLERAAALDEAEWRYGELLVKRALSSGDTSYALGVARRYHARFPGNDILALTFAKALVAAGRYAEADSALGRLDVLPREGASEAHGLYREAKLMLAVDAMAARRWTDAAALVAAAREWPERLGEGKPYEADVDERLEDWLSASILERSGRRGEAVRTWQRLAADTRRTGTASDVLRLWSLERLGRGGEAAAALREWPPSRLTAGSEGRVLGAWRRTVAP